VGFGTGNRGDYFTEAFVNETNKELGQVNDEVIRNDILNSIRAAKHKVRKNRWILHEPGTQDVSGVTAQQRRYTKMCWKSRKQRAVDALSEFMWTRPAEATPLMAPRLEGNCADMLDETVKKQTISCVSNSNRLDLRKLTIRDLADGICKPSGDIKESYLKSEFLPSSKDHAGEAS